TANYTYGELFNQINIRTGGIVPVCNIYTDSKNLDDTRVTFEWKAKVLEGGLDAAFELLEEIIFTSVLDNEKRNRELISEVKSRTQATMMSAGHQVAVGRIGTYFSKGAVITDKISGYTNYKLTEKLDNEYESIKESYIEKLNELVKYIFRKENLMFDFAGSENEYKLFEKKAEAFLDRLNEHESKDIAVMPAFDPKPVVRNEGIMSSSQVNYVCRGGNFIDKGLKYTGSLRVLKVIMSYGYLWMNVRVKNGAYGCMSSFSKSGDSFFVSYRDPNLSKTLDVYEGIPEYVENIDISDREMTQYIIGAVSELDTPLTPSSKAIKSLSAYMTNLSLEDYQKERDEVLSTDVDRIRYLSDYIKAVLEEGYVCVVGNEEAIKSEKDRFINLENMIEKA
ncbi:MAG: insulinase family protein, partial [Lachnospiraceae bacterium]|nr:insulinase family protein [Lachnospiraceae bacterium]